MAHAVDGKILHYLGCREMLWYWDSTRIWGILSCAGVFPSTLAYVHFTVPAVQSCYLHLKRAAGEKTSSLSNFHAFLERITWFEITVSVGVIVTPGPFSHANPCLQLISSNFNGKVGSLNGIPNLEWNPVGLGYPEGAPANLVDGLPFFLWCGNPWCEASLHSETSALPLCWFYGAGACWGCKRQTSGLLKFAQLRRIACCMWSGTERTQKQRLWFFMLFCTQSIIILYSVHWGGTRQWHQAYLSLG